MSRSIQPVIEAFLKGNNKKISNTESLDNRLYLFGNCIAKIDLNGDLWISDGGYNHTVTTQDRLNMLGGGIRMKKGQFYKNGVIWDGSWIKLGETPTPPIIITERTSVFN